jgi:hypothetical protein
MSTKHLKHIRYRQWFYATVAILIFMGGSILIRFTVANTASGQPYPPPSDSYIADLLEEIETDRELLAGDSLDEQMRRSIEEKLEIAIRIATRVSRPWAIVDPLETPVLIPLENSPFQTGIFEGSGGALRPAQAVLFNRWQGIVNNVMTIVFAGYTGDDREQGVVYIQRISDETRSVYWSSYLTPVRSGPVRILRAEGYRLILSTEAGDILYFDVPGDRFVSSLTEVVPTITPQPTVPLALPLQPYP